MQTFFQHIDDYLAPFVRFNTRKAVISEDFFSQREATIGEFIQEMRQTAALLSQQVRPDYAEVYADKLVKQFDCLTAIIKKWEQAENNAPFPLPLFQPRYRFSKNAHQLSPEKRLAEYRKALRVLHDKISWLIEQQLNAQNEHEKQLYQQSIAETEYRKTKCLNAIDELEACLQFKR